MAETGTNLQAFVGRFTIRNGSGVGGIIETGDTLYIGTGVRNAPRPEGNRVGLSVFTPDGEQRFPVGEEPAYFSFQAERLQYETGNEYGPPLTIVVSLYQDARHDGTVYRAPYGLVLAGDPDQVGAWGADDNPN